MKIKDAKSLAEAKIKAQEPIFPGSMRITVGTASCGIAKGAAKTLQALKSGITSKQTAAQVVAVGVAACATRSQSLKCIYRVKQRSFMARSLKRTYRHR